MRLKSDEYKRVQYQIYGINENGEYEPFKYLGKYPYIVEDHFTQALHDAGMKYDRYEVYRVTTERIA